MLVRVDTRRPFLVTLLFLIALSWLALTIWSLSPYDRYLNHEILAHLPFTLSGEYFTLVSIFVIGWLLMTVAMMLPTTLPLVMLFLRMTRRRPDHLQLVILLIAGYLGVWIIFGVLAQLGDLFVHEAVHRIAWLDANVWIISAAILALAGLYQFSSLKYMCLEACKSPLTFIIEHWQGQDEARKALWLGVRHGLFCVGCCWSLMLLMFAFACGSIAWMLVLGMIMAIEKNVPTWGRRLSAPLGTALLGASAIVSLYSMVLR